MAKGLWSCRACAERAGATFEGFSHPGGFCGAGKHRTRERIHFVEFGSRAEAPAKPQPIAKPDAEIARGVAQGDLFG